MMEGEKIYDKLKRKSNRRVEKKIKKGLAFGDLRVENWHKAWYGFSLEFKTSYKKTGNITMQTIEELVEELLPKDGIHPIRKGSDSISIVELEEEERDGQPCTSRRCFLDVKKLQGYPLELEAYNYQEAIQLAVDMAKRLGLKVETKPHMSYKSTVPFKEVVKEAFHIKRNGAHYFQHTYDPKEVRQGWERCGGRHGTKYFWFKNPCGTQTKIEIIPERGFDREGRPFTQKVKKKNLLEINTRRVKFKEMKGMSLEQIKKTECPRFIGVPCGTKDEEIPEIFRKRYEKYLKCARKFVAEEEKEDFEYVQKFLLKDQELPLELENIGDAEKKLGVLKTLEKILEKNPGLKSYAEKCGVYHNF